MSRSDAERALVIYLDFTKQTESVVSYLSTARQYQHQTRVEVPKLKHAPTNLGKQLEDYLADPDFEINRRQYLTEQEAKKGKGASNGISKPATTNSKSESESRAATDRNFPEPSSSKPSSAKPATQAKGPDPDLIDFFDSIEQNQQPMATQAMPQSHQANMQSYGGVPPFQMPQQQQFQQNGYGASPTVYQGSPPFMQQHPTQTQGIQSQQAGPLQPNFIGAGFGGYTPQPSFSPTSLSPIPQDNVATFQGQNVQPFGSMNAGQPQSNPFRQSMMAASQTGMSVPSFTASPPTTSPIAPQNTNPFKAMSGQSQQGLSPAPEQQFQQVQQASFAGNQLPAPTGTNPFARNLSPSIAQSPPTGTLMPQQTGSTNPFRQSQFVNTATGTGWQHNQVPIGGGLDHLETVPVFPRPAQQQPWQL
jgi:phosphatidylinositol-binding clathrin assembly protein